MTLHDQIRAKVRQPPKYDELPDPTLHPQEELAAGAGALLWCIAAAVVCLVTVLLVWVTG